MTIPTSDNWNAANLAHRYTVSFFKSQYGDEPSFVTATANRLNQELAYYNIAGGDNETNATICAGLMVSYMEAQGIPYHQGRTRSECFELLTNHLKGADGKVLYSADVIDYHFKFLGED